MLFGKDKEAFLTPLGGVGEVGRNCFLYEQGRDILVVDCGIMPRLPEGRELLEENGDSAWKIPYLPKLEILDKKMKGKDVNALITHAHLDHIGGIAELAKRRIPIRISSFAKRFFTTRNIENLFPDSIKPEFRAWFEQEYTFGQGNFYVDCFPLNHSIPGTFGIILKAGKKTIVHLTDFKFNGLEETRASFERTLQDIRKTCGKLDCLVLDVLNADMEGFTPPENQIVQNIQELIEDTPQGRIFITFFSSNIQRLEELLKVCKKLHRPVKVLGRGMRISLQEFLAANGEFQSSSGFGHPNEVVILAGCQGEKKSHIWRSLTGGWLTPEGRYIKADVRMMSGDTIIFSSRCIPGNEELVKNLLETLYRKKVKVVLHQGEKEKLGLPFPVKEKFIHVSGHGQQEDILRSIKILEPKVIVPAHATLDKVEILAGLLGFDAKKIANLSIGETLKI
ncbi:MAG: hypothetical protein COV69_03730 [Parcubacteria group bacterium CG11_big_fil_rev_8_21_14_0_20_39_14]|nr:MAG: hypothetical protein COV69_03730 [Parcubacteria group bacterium CG11_big_fil_rev_8_21_14_0_20_39_14]PIS35179.1 MAG: hypothetical protein COT36_03760 [Parcubacteria group bacterium CG08_land_8_20_14_0_20_38_56]